MSESALIQRYLDADNPADENALLATLIFENATPVVRRIVTRRLTTASAQEREDVSGDVTLQLLTHLKSLKRRGGEPIDRFIAYAATSAHHACDQYLRERYPERSRLKNRLRYLLSKAPSFALWEDPEQGWVCGREEWRGRPPATPDPGIVAALSHREQPPDRIFGDLFDHARQPLPFDAVVETFAAFWGIKDQADSVELVDNIAVSAEPRADDVLERKQNLERLWREIVALPEPQRVALLLNFREPQGGPAVWLLPAAGLASVRRIAELVGIAAVEFAELWGRLPIGDLEIAERLNVTRQQVINLRQAARQRLARRLASGGTQEVTNK
jgi:RNA polymerase sigma factor (sigma-70 family)